VNPKNGPQKDMYLKEIGLRVQNMITILHSIINKTGGKGGGEVREGRTYLLNM
jgi:hypothetical protein